MDVISLLSHPRQSFLCLTCPVSSWSHVASTYQDKGFQVYRPDQEELSLSVFSRPDSL